ncbi:electron transfer flavoprotein subunit alpha [uncultured archaeon]|nr:electron transfer flavoprotein subunit alpha [uncultured archaeon]
MKALVYSDNVSVLQESLTYIRKMMDADGVTEAEGAGDVLNYGAGKIYSLKGDSFYDNISSAIRQIYENGSYDFIFLGSTTLGREIAGSLSASLGLQPMTELISFEPKDGKAVTRRFAHGGKTVVEEESGAKVLTLMPGIADPEPAEGASATEEVQLGDSKLSLVERIEKQATAVNLEKAEVIVCVGRGLGKKEGISEVEPLVKAVKGELAGSRPVCLDYQWLTEDRQVGLSGKKVKPKIYIALGVSGQIQHIAGMRDSKTVIAVNKDKDAPIFEEADYGIVGDLYQIVPKLVQALQS